RRVVGADLRAPPAHTPLRPLQASVRCVPLGVPATVHARDAGGGAVDRGACHEAGAAMSIESVKVPQHLELADVVAWGLGTADLACVLIGGASAWWLYLAVPGDLWIRVVSATLPATVGL